MLEITNLCKSYKKFSLGPIDLKLEAGTTHGLVGANGAGKTTMFRCLMGTVRRGHGFLKVNGNIADDKSGSWKQSIGYVGDFTPFFEHWSGSRNLQALSAYYENWSDETVQSLASRFDLNLSQIVKHYSTGERSKLATIVAIAHQPALLLLDEPATGMDPVARSVFIDVLYEQMQNENLTLLYATHHVSEIENLADALIFIRAGRIIHHECQDNFVQEWRKITFRSAERIGEIPNQIFKVSHGQEYEVISDNYQNTLWFLEKSSAESIQVNRLATEEICVHILKNRRHEA